MPLKIVRNDITNMHVEVIVNSANWRPEYGRGTDAAVYKSAGEKELLAERKEIGKMAYGECKETKEYDLEKKLDSEVDVIKINNETDKMFLKNILNEAIVFLDDKGKFNSTYREIEKFFIENSDFIELRERDLIG